MSIERKAKKAQSKAKKSSKLKAES